MFSLGAFAIMMACGVFKGKRNWIIFGWVVVVVIVFLRVGDWVGLLPTCSLTDLEYYFREIYAPGGDWFRSRSLLGTVVYNITGFSISETFFTVLWGVVLVMLVVSLIIYRKRKSENN